MIRSVIALPKMIDNDILKYSKSYMSNTKWRKLFSLVNSESMTITACKWKLVNEKEPQNGWLPDYRQLGEDYVGDCGALNGPFEFKAIEWVLLPSEYSYKPNDKAPTKYRYQNIEELRQKIESAGKFEYEVLSEGIKIFGYRP
jgi:hypothetical protein